MDLSEPERRIEELLRGDAALLARIGSQIDDQVRPLVVELPADLAAAAHARWAETGYTWATDPAELVRERASTFVRIGEAVQRNSTSTDDGAISVVLDIRLVGGALVAADEEWAPDEG